MWQLVIFEMLRHLPIKIPIKQCQNLKTFQQQWKIVCYNCVVWRMNRISVRKFQDLTSHLQLHLGLCFLLSSSVPHTSLLCLLSVLLSFLFDLQFRRVCILLAALISLNEWFPLFYNTFALYHFLPNSLLLFHQELLAEKKKSKNINYFRIHGINS